MTRFANREISHVFAFKRDRLGRPDDPVEMLSVERRLNSAGITLVFSDAEANPRARGESRLPQDIQSLIAYHSSGEFLDSLADRVIRAHIGLARKGFSTGGTPPYGFARYLADESGQKLEKLEAGKRVRKDGCHVRWFPEDREKIAVWLLILERTRDGWGASRIARFLNERGIPSPGAGTRRRDQGVLHKVSGRWNPNTVRALCRNSAIMGIREYGVRSEGTHKRLGANGPQSLDDRDYPHVSSDMPKLIRNPDEVRIPIAMGIDPQCDATLWEQVQHQLNQRGSSQRGIPRSRDLSRYPLSCRVVDLTGGCGAVMHGITNGGRRLYKCSAYMQTRACYSNSVDGDALLRFVLRAIREQVIRLGDRPTLRRLLQARVAAEQLSEGSSVERKQIERDRQMLEELNQDIRTVECRMATERDDDRYEALGRQFEALRDERSTIRNRIERAESKHHKAATIRASTDEQVETALQLFDHLERLADDPQARVELLPMFERLGLRVGLYFKEAIKGTKRRVRILDGGILVFGDRELPIALHGALNLDAKAGHNRGPKSPKQTDSSASKPQSGEVGQTDSPRDDRDGSTPLLPQPVSEHHPKQQAFPSNHHREEISITKVSRGERI